MQGTDAIRKANEKHLTQAEGVEMVPTMAVHEPDAFQR